MAVKKYRTRDGYGIDFVDQTGRRVREYGGRTKREAERKLADRRHEVHTGTYVHPKDAAAAEAQRETFADFADRFVTAHTARSVYYREQLSASGPIMETFGAVPLDEITSKAIYEFMDARSKVVGPGTVRKQLTVLHTMFRWGVRRGALKANPAHDIDKPAEPTGKLRFLTRDEWEAFIDEAPAYRVEMYTVAVATGMRLGEIAALTWEAVDLAAGIARVDEDTKTGHRNVRLSGAAIEALRRVPRHVNGDHVFRNPEGDPWAGRRQQNRLSKLTRAMAREAGLDDVGFHTLRHTCASWLVQAGVPLTHVGKHLGHRTVQTTMRYAHLAPDHLDVAMAAIDNALGECHFSDTSRAAVA